MANMTLWQVQTPAKRANEDLESPVKTACPKKRRVREKRMEIPPGPSELSEWQIGEIRRLVAEAKATAEREETPCSGNVNGISYDKTPSPTCSICNVSKHHVKWGEMRTSLRTGRSVPRGTQCYSCTHSATLLGAKCRSRTIFEQVDGALDVWRVRSALERKRLRRTDEDNCTCGSCVG